MIQAAPEIVKGINMGDEKSFKRLYDMYWSYLCSLATVYVPNPQIVEEIVNDVFLNIWAHRGHYNYPIHGYLVNSVKNACVTKLRSETLKTRLKESYEKDLLVFAQQRCLTDDCPLELLSAKETEARIHAIADSLPQRCRQVFEKYFYYGESTDAIAEEMGISQSTVRVHIKTALDRMKSELGMAVLFAYIFGGFIS
ncbi:MAG: RNA polymerase sigma-70 factor [Candidatus Cryptobacteroides sp.]